MSLPVFVMSFYKSSKYLPPNLVLMTKHAVTLLQSHGYEVHFLGNDEALQEFSEIEWNYTDNSLNNISKEYRYTWSFSKLEAFKKCCNMYEKFYHVDQDVFIFNPLTQNILNEDIVVQSKERASRYSGMSILKKHCNFIPDIFNIDMPDNFYNMGFFGGKSDTLIPIVESCLKFVSHPLNKYFFTNEEFNDGCTQAMLAEQGYFGYYVKAKNISVLCIQECLKGYYHHGFHKYNSNKEEFCSLDNIKIFLEKWYGKRY